MKYIPINSTNIASIGYIIESKLLEINFTNGKLYKYFDVDEHDVIGLIFSVSSGSYFHKNLKKYKYQEV